MNLQDTIDSFQWHAKPGTNVEIDGRISKAASNGVDFYDRYVLEPGCGEGSITASLCWHNAKVTAFDVRADNLLRTFTRCLRYRFTPQLFVDDAERIETYRVGQSGKFDLIVHIGLLYHLRNPVSHLVRVLNMAPEILLDTHVAADGSKHINEDVEGHWYTETEDDRGSKPGQERSFWLTRDSLASVIEGSGFSHKVLTDDPKARCGHRVLWLLRKISK